MGWLRGRVGIATAAFFVILVGCSCNTRREDGTMSNYFKALERTDPATGAVLEPGSAAEEEALDRFETFYQVFSEEIVRRDLHSVYGENAYFQDPFKEVIGVEAIYEYFLNSAETVHECTFDITDVAVHKGEYYFRWTMNLTTKRYKDRLIQAPGMSHVRFDKDGMVVFHQDYWDATVIFEQVFLLGSIIRWIKSQF